jgi:flagellin-like protein
MKMVLHGRKRKAISPVLATVILIAITLIAAIAIAGFVFGLFGSFTSSAQVQASVTTCTYAVPTYESCTLQVLNSGSANTATAGCSLTLGGVTYTGTTGAVANHVQAAITATAGGSTTIFCNLAAATPAVAPPLGSRITGSLQMTNGASVPFSGTQQ